MGIAYLAITILLAAMVTFSGIGKIRRDPRIVQVIHEVVGVPLKYLPLLAACEFAGALGVVLGIWWPLLGVAAGIGLVIYFVGASVSHSARRRCQRHWTRCIHVGGRGGSTCPAHPDIQAAFCWLDVEISRLRSPTSIEYPARCSFREALFNKAEYNLRAHAIEGLRAATAAHSIFAERCWF